MLASAQKTILVSYTFLPLDKVDSIVLICNFKNSRPFMNRRHTPSDFNSVDYIELNKKTAIHEAAHAAAIYFGNKQKQLPPIFFQIIISDYSSNSYDDGLTKVEGGRLIHTLPSSLEEATSNFSPAQKQAYQQAFEADIINLLVGSLAEAYYVAQIDNELINPYLVPMTALHNYGGASDLEVVNDYLQCFIADKTEQEKKVTELFWAAFDFISNWAHWYAITALANHVLSNNKNIIDYEEVVTVLESHFTVAKKRTSTSCA
jgi:hypothetical protein